MINLGFDCPACGRTCGEDLAFVEFNGQRQYLGTYGTEESKKRYAKTVAEQRTGLPTVLPSQITIDELVDVFLAHAEAYYRRPSGEITNEVELFTLAVRPLLAIYSGTRAAEFGPKRLKAVRQRMIDAGHKLPETH